MVMSHVMIITWNHSDQKELSDEYYTKKFHKVNKEDRRDDDKLRRRVGVSVSLCHVYGDLQGLNKQETAKIYGKDQAYNWPRSYAVQPPNGESLEMCLKRVVARLMAGKHKYGTSIIMKLEDFNDETDIEPLQLLLLNVSHYKLRSLSESVGSSFSLDELQANGMLQLPTSVEME
ncbi:histidine phosphatase superfamily protein [Tanacetum coccineum]